MVIYSFPFIRDWDAITLRRNIKELPVLDCHCFEYVKVGVNSILGGRVRRIFRGGGGVYIMLKGGLERKYLNLC